MKKTWLLFVCQCKARFRPQHAAQGKSGAGRLGIGLVLLFSLASVGFLYVQLFSHLMDAALAVSGEAKLAIDVAVLGAMVQALLFGLFFVFGELFLSSDGPFLSSLPLSGRQVFGAKFLYLYVIHLGLSALLFLPPVVLYAVKVGGGLVFFLKAAFVLLLLPVFPLLLSVVLSFLFMLLLLPVRHKERVFTFASILLVLALVAGQFFLSARLADSAGDGSGWFAELLGKYQHTIQSIVQPPASWASAAVTGTPTVSLLTLILFTVSALLALAVVFALGGFFYRRFAAVSTETAANRRRKARREGIVAPKRPLRALFSKEWRAVLRSTVYATNSLIAGPMMVLVLLFPLFQQEGNFSQITATAAQLPPSLAMLAMAAAVAFPAMMNIGAFTVFSREGSAFWQLKTLPVPTQTFVGAKMLFGASVNLTHALPMFLLAVLLFRLPPLPAAGGLLLGLSLAVAATAAGMLPDAARPKLGWTNETEAMKQNMNGMLGMLLAFIALGLMGGGGAFLLFGLRLPVWLPVAALLLVSLAASALLFLLHVKIARKTWPGMDV